MRPISILLALVAAASCSRSRAKPLPLRVEIEGSSKTFTGAFVRTTPNEAVDLVLGTGTKCNDEGSTLRLDLAPALLVKRDEKLLVPDGDVWLVTQASYSDSRNVGHSILAQVGTAAVPPNVAHAGGTVKLDVRSPQVVVDGTAPTTPCPGPPSIAAQPALPVEVKFGPRDVVIRGAVLVKAENGEDGEELELSDGPLECSYGQPRVTSFDLQVRFLVPWRGKTHARVHGGRVPPNSLIEVDDNPFKVTREAGNWVEVTIDARGKDAPFVVRGRIPVRRCPRP